MSRVILTCLVAFVLFLAVVGEAYADDVILPTGHMFFKPERLSVSTPIMTDIVSEGLDTSQRVSASGYAAIKSAGYSVVGRYLEITPDTGAPTYGAKVYFLTPDELYRAIDKEVGVFLIFEWGYSTKYIPSGYKAGVRDATIAQNALSKLNLPWSTVVYYSLDRATRISQANINEYFRGIRDTVSTSAYVGCYGSKAQLVALKKLDYISYLWHARWLDNNPYPLTWEQGWGCHMYQSTAIIRRGGVYCDQNWSFINNIGQIQPWISTE